MTKMKKGEHVSIVAYKHDGTVHRTWKKGILLDASDDRIIVLNNNTLVTESGGRKWRTREPAICVFYPNRWFNIICMIRDKGIFYYCNMASPALLDNNSLKYIDYELDVKVFPNGNSKILDKEEYRQARIEMLYSQDIDEILWKELDQLLLAIRERKDPFNAKWVYQWYKEYQESKKT